ncbi:MAG: signal peptidase I [Lachnospiraceae bacterium]|nr:signal peptidase I [Lachnospiraceae bacterium]MDD6192310.1 signal peptidase I [Lachnospiraceae bacterium]MDY4793908.1 signal peptidase I [Pararoseburia sp.]
MEELEKADTVKKDKKEEKNVVKEIVGMILYVVAVFAVCFLIITYVGQRTKVEGSSMEPTLSNGDNLIVDKISYRFRNPERFDIIIFPYKYEKDTFFIKRIIGMPGETVWINNSGEIYINGVLLSENYGLETIKYAGLASTPITLGKDEYFVMGDNRNDSTDSRFDVVGPIKRKEIVGRAWVRIYPFNKFGVVKHQ